MTETPPPAPPETPLWLQATLKDAEGFDFEAPLASADTNSVEKLYFALSWHKAKSDRNSRCKRQGWDNLLLLR